jgi:hypothetical protein
VLLLCDYFCAFSGTTGINHKHPSANCIIPPVLAGRLPGITKRSRSFVHVQNGASSSSSSRALPPIVDMTPRAIEIRSLFVMGVPSNRLRHPALHCVISFFWISPWWSCVCAGLSVLACQDLSPGESGNGTGHRCESK